MKIAKDGLEATLKVVLTASWHNPERRDWMAALLAVLVVESELARSKRPGAATAAERIAWEFGQMVKDPAQVASEAAEHLATLPALRADGGDTPGSEAVGANEPTPNQQGEDATQFNALANQLLEAFGVRAALFAAFPRMQSNNRPFNAPEIWDELWAWMTRTFFPGM